MAHRGPVVTAVVVLGGLVGFMTANSAGAPTEKSAAPEPAAGTATRTPGDKEPPKRASTPPSSSSSPPTSEAPQFPAEVVYAGKTRGNPMTVAVAVKGGQVSAYLCDGAGVESWLRGTARDGRVDVRGKDGESRLTAALTGRKLAGTVTVGSQVLSFAVGVAPPPAGLYRGKNGDTTVGWIILTDGSQVGVATTAGRSEPAPALDPAAGAASVDGRRVAAEKVAGDTTFGS